MDAPEILQAGVIAVLALVLQLGTVALALLIVNRCTDRDAPLRGLQRLRTLGWNDFDAPLLLGIMILVQLTALAATPLVADRVDAPESLLPMLALAIQVTIAPLLVGGLFLVLMRRRGIRADALLGPLAKAPWRTLGWSVWYYVAALPLVAAAAGIGAYVFHHFGWPIERQPVLTLLLDDQTPAALRWYAIAMAATVVPLVEEVVFRGVLLPLALRLMKPATAIVLVSLVFAALHLHPPSLAPLGVLACIFSVAYLNTGSLAVPVLMHMLFNGGSLLLMLLLGDAQTSLLPR